MLRYPCQNQAKLIKKQTNKTKQTKTSDLGHFHSILNNNYYIAVVDLIIVAMLKRLVLRSWVLT